MRHPIWKTALSAATILGLAGCPGDKNNPPPKDPSKVKTDGTKTDGTKTDGTTPPPSGAEVVKISLQQAGIDPDAMDRSIDPCQDFYQFACGNWINKATIPSDKPMWMRSFLAIEEENLAYLKTVLDASLAKPSSDPVDQKLSAFYGACMDETALEATKLKALDPLMASIKKVKDVKTLAAAVTLLHKHQIWALFDITSLQDSKDATQVIAAIDQNGLGLPDRDYYLNDDPETKKLQDAYKAYVEEILTLGGMKAKDAKAAAADIWALETEIAKVSKTQVERRDPNGTYNRIERDGLKTAAPAFPWDDYFAGLGQPGLTTITVTSVPFFEGVNKLLGSTKPAVWQRYLTFHALSANAGALPKAFQDAGFKFAQKLTGLQEQPPRWKRCVEATDGALGELLGQSFVRDKFAGDSKKAAEEMVKAVSIAFGENLKTLDWMDDATKAKAKEKLDKMAYLIGYPAKWREYDFPIDPKGYTANSLAARAYGLQRDLAKVGKPVDRGEWYMTPPTVNAYYDPQVNQMVFPAGILQPPFYSVNYKIPVNLGAIGVVVGHELTHGFDDQGAQFDANGNLQDWWSPSVKEKFQAKTGCVVKQYAEYEAVPGAKLNGELTQGENIADIGGVKMAFRAYRLLRKDAKQLYVADGFTEDQQFFLGFGQAWCSKSREEFSRLLVNVDPHSPGRWRVNGSVSDTPEFAAAFGCKKGTVMAPQNACVVW